MLIPIPEEVLQAQARDRMLDAVLGGVGVSAAIVSASFAAYMAVVGPVGPSAPGTAPLLAAGGSPTHAPRRIAALPPPREAPPEGGDLDFDPTGSIPAASATAAPPAAGQTVLPDFAVRDAFEGTALVEAHGTLRMVQPGADLDGAGRVLSISRRGAGWAVATTGGLILQRR